MAAAEGPVDLTIVGGFLGAGKTSLVNHLLGGAGGRRLAILVNDFGAINIDEKLIARRNERVISFANGCICCDFGDNIYQTLFRLLEAEPRPEGIVIETSGVADPNKLALLGKVGKFLRLNATVILVDAAHIRAHLGEPYLEDTILRQIAAADLLIVNKADLVPPEELAALEAWLGTVAPRAARLRAVGGAVPVGILLGPPPREPPGTTAIAAPAPEDAGHAHPPGSAHEHSERFASFSFAADRPFAAARLKQAVQALPAWLLRGKGLLWLDAEPGPVIFHQVGGRSEFVAAGAWTAPPRSELVFIAGAGRDFAAIRAALAQALI